MQQIRVIEDNPIEPMGGGKVVEGGNISIPIKQESEQQHQIPIRVIEESNPNYFQQEETEEQQEKRAPKNRRPLKSRPEAVQINRLNQMLHEQQAENERLRQEAEHYRMQASHKEQIAVINHENALNVRQESAKTMMKDAMEAGDAEKVAEATQIIADSSNQLKDLERAKQSYSYEPAYIPQSQPQDYYPVENAYEEEDPYAEEAREEISNAVNEFLIENPWCDPENPKYEKTKHNKFLYEGKKLAQKYIDQGERDYLDSKQFLEEVSSRMEKYLDKINSSQRSGSMVSPVNRGSGSYGKSNPNEVTMTRAEYETFSRLPEVMRNKDTNHLLTKWQEAKADLMRKGKIGKGLQMRPPSLGRY